MKNGMIITETYPIPKLNPKPEDLALVPYD